LFGDVDADVGRPRVEQSAEHRAGASRADWPTIQTRDRQQARRRAGQKNLVGSPYVVRRQRSIAAWNAEPSRQFGQRRHADAGENLVAGGRHEPFPGEVQHEVGGRRFRHETVAVQEQRPCAGTLSSRLAIRQVVVHAAATLQFGRPAFARNLTHVRDDKCLP